MNLGPLTHCKGDGYVFRPQNQHLEWLDFLMYQHHRKFDLGVGDSEGIVRLEERMSSG